MYAMNNRQRRIAIFGRGRPTFPTCLTFLLSHGVEVVCLVVRMIVAMAVILGVISTHDEILGQIDMSEKFIVPLRFRQSHMDHGYR